MFISDILATLQWWLVLLVLGVGFLPLTSHLFKPFFDKGYIFSKLFGLIISSYVIFLLGLLHIISFSTFTSYFVFFVLAAIIIFSFRSSQNILKLIKNNWKTFLLEELFFLIALFFWAYIRSFSPDIHGLEKYMDYGFINSILRGDYFPPKDMWFPPLFINYYYFGHLMTAVLTKLSNLPSNITFNLMLSTVFAFCITESFSIAANLYTSFAEKIKFFKVKRFIAGFLGAILVTLSGNIHVLYGFFKAYPNESPVPIWQLPFLPFSFPNSYWYPNATRFIHNTIHEFPIYSWVVSDLHGHVLDIPIVLLTIAFLLSIFISKTNGHQKNLFEILNYVLVGFLLAIMYMTNAWDGAIYFLLAMLIVVYLNTQKFFDFKKIIVSSLIILCGFVVFTLPYNINFKPFVSGIGILCAPDFLVKIQKLGPFIFEADHCQHSPWWQLLMLYGFFYFFVISFLIFVLRAKKIFQTDQFVLLLIILSTFLILLPEFIYVKDIYPAHYRANTMFKLVFQSFIMLSLACGYIIVRLLSNKKSKLLSIIYLPLTVCLIYIVMLYPYQAINSYYEELKTYHGLDGTAYLSKSDLSDYEAIKWLNENVSGQPVILEAQGDSYTDFARVSANTGLPTVLGWTVHEWLWRGTYDIPSPRIADVKTLYETEKIEETKSLIKKYDIEYVFVGKLEYQKYPKLKEEKFQQLGKIVFLKGKTKIYKINSF